MKGKILTERGNCYFNKEDMDSALKDYGAAIQIDPANTMAFTGRGNVYDENGDHDKAIADYTEAIRLDPKYATAYINRAVTLNRKGKHDEAIADCNTAIGLTSESADAYEDRGIGYDGKGDRAKAMADYNKVIELDPKYAEAYIYRGQDYAAIGNYNKAITDLNMALQLSPGSAFVCNQLAWLLATSPDAEIRDGKKAVEYAAKACELTHWKRPAEMDTLAAAYAETGDFTNAVKYGQQYLAFPDLDEKSKAAGKERLALYQAGKPWHQEKK